MAEHWRIVWADRFPSGGKRRHRMNGWWFVLIGFCGTLAGLMFVIMFPDTAAWLLLGWF